MKQIRHYWILYFLLLYSVLLGQNPSPYFRNFGSEAGLPSPEVHCIFQDHKGQMWFGTDNGISRFDGYQFKTYDSKDGLLDNVVLNIFEDQFQKLWFGTMSGRAIAFSSDSIYLQPYTKKGQIPSHRSVGITMTKSDLHSLTNDRRLNKYRRFI